MDKSDERGSRIKENTIEAAQTGDTSETGRDEGVQGAVFWILAVVVVGIAAAARFAFIGRYEVWLDEAYCFSVAKGPIWGIFKDLALDNGPPLYYVMLHYWMRVFGESPAALRGLSAVFSTGAVAAVVLWKTEWFSRGARLLAGLILAITPLAVYYAQEARMYSPVLFFTVVATIFLERGLTGGRKRDWALFGLFTALGLYTSYVAIFLAPLGYIVVGAGYLFDKDEGKAKRRLGGLIAAHLAAALVFAAWLPTFLNQPSAEATQWIRPLWEAENKALAVPRSLSVMTVGGAQYPRYLRQMRLDGERVEATRKAVADGRESRAGVMFLSAVPPALPLVAGIVLTAVFFVGGLWRGGGRFPLRVFLLSYLLLTITAPFALSFLSPMYLLGRYELTGIPAVAVISGLGLWRLRKWAAPAVIVAVCLFGYSWGYAQSFGGTGAGPVKGEALAAAVGQADVVLAEAFEYAPVYYYAGEGRDQIDFLTFPRETKSHSAWIDGEKWFFPEDLGPRESLYEEARATLAEAMEKVGAGGRLIIVRPSDMGKMPGWVVQMDAVLHEAVKEALGERLAPDMESSRVEVGIVVFRVTD